MQGKECSGNHCSKQTELGAACSIDVPTAAVAVISEGRGKKQIDDVVKKIQELKKIIVR